MIRVEQKTTWRAVSCLELSKESRTLILCFLHVLIESVARFALLIRGSRLVLLFLLRLRIFGTQPDRWCFGRGSGRRFFSIRCTELGLGGLFAASGGGSSLLLLSNRCEPRSDASHKMMSFHHFQVIHREREGEQQAGNTEESATFSPESALTCICSSVLHASMSSFKAGTTQSPVPPCFL